MEGDEPRHTHQNPGQVQTLKRKGRGVARNHRNVCRISPITQGPACLRALARRLSSLALDIRAARIRHADLQVPPASHHARHRQRRRRRGVKRRTGALQIAPVWVERVPGDSRNRHRSSYAPEARNVRIRSAVVICCLAARAFAPSVGFSNAEEHTHASNPILLQTTVLVLWVAGCGGHERRRRRGWHARDGGRDRIGGRLRSRPRHRNSWSLRLRQGSFGHLGSLCVSLGTGIVRGTLVLSKTGSRSPRVALSSPTTPMAPPPRGNNPITIIARRRA